MGDSEHPEKTGESVPDASWPENGDQWSDSGEEDDECGLLQAMAAEDEEIDLYNEETFGLDEATSGDNPDADPMDLLLLCSDNSPTPQSSPPPPPRSPSPHSSYSPSKPGSRVWPHTPTGWSQRGRAGRGQLFDDPAVVKTVEGRRSLKSLDSAIVDCSLSSYWEDLKSNTDQAILGVIDGSRHGRVPPVSPNFLSPMQHFSASWGRRGLSFVGSFNQRCHYQAQKNPMVPCSPFRPQRLFSPQQQYNQPGGFLSPSRPPLSTPMPHTPKLMHHQFGTDSPRPAPFYSPSTNIMQGFRAPGPVAQFHPQHKRLLSQRQQRPHRCGQRALPLLGNAGFLYLNLNVIHRKPVSWDPYSQIMSDKEKEWIIRLQMIQLQSENPHLDDYYYQEYYQRMEAKLAEEEFLGDRLKKEPPKLTTPYVTKTLSYIPVVHIEGSLGQVAVSSCFSPRRAIDAVHANTPDEEHKYTRQQRLEVLSTIEKLYIVLLEVEEADKMKATVSDKDEEKRLVQNIQRKVEQLYNELRCTNLLDSGDEFLSCLLISKGKRLLARLLRFLSHDTSLHILGVVTKHLPVLMSRDTDEALPILYPSLRAVIDRLAFSQLIRILKEFTASLPDSKDTCLTLACQNKFGLSLLYALLSQGEKILSSDIPMEPSVGDSEAWTNTVFHVARQLSQTTLAEPLLLPSNLLTLFCRYLDKRTVHQLKNNLESATGYLAVAS
uniref:PAT1 homolog 2 n=1 Tax=Cyprinus carpio TaxID=7962 RepID=A0A8C2PTU0_CYPCA